MCQRSRGRHEFWSTLLRRGGELVYDVPCIGHEIRMSLAVEPVVIVVIVDVKVAAVLRGGHWGCGGRDGKC